MPMKMVPSFSGNPEVMIIALKTISFFLKNRTIPEFLFLSGK